MTGPLPTDGLPGGMPGAPSPPTPKPSMSSATADAPAAPAMPSGAPTPDGGAPAMPGGGGMPAGIGEQIDNLPPGAETAAKLLQNPVVAALASVVLTAVTGTPISPNQVIMGAKIGGAAIKARREEKELEAEAGNGPKMGG